MDKNDSLSEGEIGKCNEVSNEVRSVDASGTVGKVWAQTFPRMPSKCVIVSLMLLKLPKFNVLMALEPKLEPQTKMM